MKLPVIHSELGRGVLTADHSASSYGFPVFVPDGENTAYGPGDAPGGRLDPIPGYNYSREEAEWLRALLQAPDDGANWRVGRVSAPFWATLGGKPALYPDEGQMVPVTIRLPPSLKAWAEQRGGIRAILERVRKGELRD